jgi:hypothetical protein
MSMIRDKKVLRDAAIGMSKVQSEHFTKHYEAEIDLAHLIITLQTLVKIPPFPESLMREHNIIHPEYSKAEWLLIDHLRVIIDKRKEEALRAEASGKSAKKSLTALREELRTNANA